jgi:Na+/serine symporter
MISMFIGDKTIHQLKEVFIEELKQLFPELVVNLVANSKAQLLNNLEQKWRPIIEPALLLGTKNIRWIAFVIGFMWGALILLIIH